MTTVTIRRHGEIYTFRVMQIRAWGRGYLWGALSLFLFPIHASAHPLDKVEKLARTASLSGDTLWRYRILGVYAPQQLPKAFQDAAPTRETTLTRLELFKARDSLSAENRALLDSFTARRSALADGEDITLSGPAVFLDVGTYRVHYTQQGQDTASAEVLANVSGVIQQTLTAQRDTLGYTLPPVAEDGRYHVYLSDKEGGQSGVYGYVQPYEVVNDNPNSATVTETAAMRSYMVLDNDFSPDQFQGNALDNLKITFAHEHYHSIQFGYTNFGVNTGPPLVWTLESGATWMETKVYPDLFGNYLEYADNILGFPQLNFFTVGGDTAPRLRQYASFLVHVYVDEHDPKGTAMQKSILSRAVASPDTSPLDHFVNALTQETGFVSLGALVQELTVAWVLHTPNHTSGRYTFKNAAQLVDGGGAPLSVPLNSGNLAAAPLGADYARFEVPEGSLTKLTLNTEGNFSVAVVTVEGDDFSKAVVSAESVVSSDKSASLELKKGVHYLRALNTSTSYTSTQQAILSVNSETVEDPGGALACHPACTLSLTVDLIAAAKNLGQTAPDVLVDVVKTGDTAVSCLKTPMAAPAKGGITLSLDTTLCPGSTPVNLVLKNIPAGFTRSAQGSFDCQKSAALSALVAAESSLCELATPATAGDANGDTKIDLKDLGVIKQKFGQQPGGQDAADFNGDGKIDLKDLGVLKKYFNFKVD